MVATRKRVCSDGVNGDQGGSVAGSSRPIAQLKTSKRKNATDRDTIVQIWQDGVSVAELGGDTIDPASIPSEFDPHARPALTTPFLLRTGAPSDALFMSRLRFGGSSHALAQSLGGRFAAQLSHISKDQFRYRASLCGHLSCINALALSRGQGRWLASAGDDKEIHIRDMFVDLHNKGQTAPVLMLKGHDSNIFSLDWSADNRYLFSTGNDSQILYYDVEHSSLPARGKSFTPPQSRTSINQDSIGGHDDSVPELSAHPTNPNLLLSCDDGGSLKLVDIRMPHDCVAAARSDAVSAFSSVQWNPNPSDGNTFAAATCGRITGSTRLYDVRQCFSSDDDRPLSSKDAVLSYHTGLIQNSTTRGLIAASAETNSLCFDPEGRFLASSISRYHPTIYAVNDPDPLATLESTIADDLVKEDYNRFCGVPIGTPSAPKKLSSCCTIKHGSFGLEAQTGKLHYAIGSDDFRAYLFEIPSKDELLHRRELVDRHTWLHETKQLHLQRQASAQTLSQVPLQKSKSTQRDAAEPNSDVDEEIDSDDDMVPDRLVDHDSEVAYCAGSILRAQNIVRPARITRQAFVLCGGRSIINTALIHPTLPLVLTAGIVSEINIHSAGPLSSVDLRPADAWSSEPGRRIGGTRPRFLLPPSHESLMDEGSMYSDTHNEDEEEEAEASDMDENEPADLDDSLSDAEDQVYAESGSESDDRTVSENSIDGTPSSAGSDGELGTELLRSNSRESQEQENQRADGLAPAIRLQYSASQGPGSEQGSPVQDGTDEEALEAVGDQGSDEQRIVANEGSETDIANQNSEPQGTVHDFLTAMRDDPMFATSAPLDYQHDRHIGTYSLSHLPPNLASQTETPSPSSSASNSEMNEEEEEEADECSEDYDGLDGLQFHDDLEDDWKSEDPCQNDGYGPESELSFDLDYRMEQDLRDNFGSKEDYDDPGKMWAMSRVIQASSREQRRIRLFDDLLRRDEMRSLTAGFRKVPGSAGGTGKGSGFTCQGCERSIDSDP